MDLELEIGAGPGAAKIVTKKVEYTARSPLYAVQIGAFSRLVPMWKFEGLNNVDAFMDRMGTIRYVMGHFNYVGDSIIGSYVNMGAGSKLANLHKGYQDDVWIYQQIFRKRWSVLDFIVVSTVLPASKFL